MDKRKLDIIPQCLSISFKRSSNGPKYISADELYKRFVNVNSCYYWNLNLKEVFDNMELLGFIKPYCLLIGGGDIFIQSIKIAFKKRLLRAPESFYITYFGDLDPVRCESILPSQFVSLDESLCYIIYDLNLHRETSTFDMICSRLAEWYPSLQLPPQFLILATLRSLLEAGQVYYTGYGYNIMTTDKMVVASWLGQQSPLTKSATGSEQDHIEATRTTSSISDCSNGIINSSQLKSKALPSGPGPIVHPRVPQSSNIINSIKYPLNPPELLTVPDQTMKLTKTRSAVRQFFSKFKPRHQKSRSMPNSKTDANITGIYDDESCYYTFNRRHPVFFSSTAEFPSHFTTHLTDLSAKASLPHNSQWLWNTSLQSLSKLNSKRSVSTHSKLSTQAIHDESPPRNPSISSRRDHVREQRREQTRREHSQSRHSQHREKRVHSIKPEQVDKLSDHRHHYTTSDTLPDDSGVHSMSISHSRVASDVAGKPRRSATSYHRYRSMELKPAGGVCAMKQEESAVIPKCDSSKSAYRGLTRSFSTRLSAVNPVLHRSKLDCQDNRHVMFQDHCGTMY